VRGRPKARYADSHIEELNEFPGWAIWMHEPDEADRILRKLRREGFEAKTLTLDEHTQLLAARNPNVRKTH
jgi:hypothetical protein